MTGINLIGHLNESSGLGNTARLFAQVIRRQGIEICALDVDGYSDEKANASSDWRLVRTTDELPHDTNLIIVSIQLLPSLFCNRAPGLLDARFKNIGVLFWELPVIPPPWIPALRLFDAIVVCSQYVRSAVELACPEVPTMFAEHPLQTEQVLNLRAKSRSEFGLTQDDVVFAASFDLRSDFTRKNPLAVLQAFKQGLSDVPQARLLLKANGQTGGSARHPSATAILSLIEHDPRILLIEQTMAYPEVLSLYALCDVFVSLHRAEGLGLGPMEAMLLGKPAIATGYSGNLTYMTEQNSILIPYRLVAPDHTVWHFRRSFVGPQAAWADPDIRAAAAAMRRACLDIDLRRRLGERARHDITLRQHTAWEAAWLQAICSMAPDAARVRTRPKLRRRLQISEFSHPIMLRMNLKELMNRVGR